jgi:serine/threonine-protein kinase HipA
MAGRSLQIWLHGVHVADLVTATRGALRCRYTEEALARWPGNTPMLSCSLPLDDRPLPAEAFLRGLLPEGSALNALAARADVPASDTFGLLARYGRDIAGAVVFSDGPPDTGRYAVEPYSEDGLAGEVAGLEQLPLGVHDDSELSLAGLQNKMLLVALPGGGWGRPVHGQPSTHILKVDNAAWPGLVEAEAACLALAEAGGLTAIEPVVAHIGAQPCLIVARYDRRTVGKVVERVHQEDCCQALGRTAKYQSRGRGGPSFAETAVLLERYAADPERQLRRLLATATFTLAIDNGDAHGKNLALLHDPIGAVSLAPLYDTCPTVMWPRLRTELAMALDGHYSLYDCDRWCLHNEARGWSVPEATAREVVDGTLESLRNALRAGVITGGSHLALTIGRRVENLLLGATAGPPAKPFA